MIDIDILYSGSAVVFSNLALGRLVLFVKRWFISHIIFPVHGPSSPGREKPWESRILYGEYGVSSRWEWEWLNNAQHMGMARNKWFNTKICHSHLLNHLFWAHGSTQWFNNIAGSCWVDLDRESQDLPAKGRLRRVPDANHQWFSVERHGPWDLTWVFLRTREEHPYGIDQHGNQRITWSHLSGMFSIKHKRFDHQRWRFNQQTCDWTITWTDTRQEWGTRLKHWVKKRQWFQPVVDCGVFCVQPQNFWVNYVWLCTIMCVYMYVYIYICIICLVMYVHILSHIYLLNLKITFACSSSQAFFSLTIPPKWESWHEKYL